MMVIKRKFHYFKFKVYCFGAVFSRVIIVLITSKFCLISKNPLSFAIVCIDVLRDV